MRVVMFQDFGPRPDNETLGNNCASALVRGILALPPHGGMQPAEDTHDPRHAQMLGVVVPTGCATLVTVRTSR